MNRNADKEEAMNHINKRRLVAIDLENLLGCAPSRADAHLWASAAEQFLVAIAFQPGVDQAVVATDPDWAFDAALAMPGARLLVGAGESGADRALCDALADSEHIRQRYAAVVIGSGDHIFTGAAAALRAVGVPVKVVSLGLMASGALMAAADDTMLLSRPQLALAA